MSINVDAFLEPPSRRKYSKNKSDKQPDFNRSVVQIIEKSAALHLVDMLELAGNDSPIQWSQAIAAWIEQQDGMEVETTLPELCESLNLVPVEVWLGLLLGNFQNHKVSLRQNGFYQSITVTIEKLLVDATHKVIAQI